VFGVDIDAALLVPSRLHRLTNDAAAHVLALEQKHDERIAFAA
jgi:hypothetical protein